MVRALQIICVDINGVVDNPLLKSAVRYANEKCLELQQTVRRALEPPAEEESERMES